MDLQKNSKKKMSIYIMIYMKSKGEGEHKKIVSCLSAEFKSLR